MIKSFCAYVVSKLECWDLNILGDPGADSGGEGESKRAEKYGTKKSKELFSPFFTFLRAKFFRPFRLSFAPTICPWVSGDVLFCAQVISWYRGV